MKKQLAYKLKRQPRPPETQPQIVQTIIKEPTHPENLAPVARRDHMEIGEGCYWTRPNRHAY